jgi:hypothetical protein
MSKDILAENYSWLDKFIELLWGPLIEQGFEYSFSKKENSTVFNVTRCPVYEQAKELGAEEWMFRLFCMTDGPSAEGFNPRVKFTRTKTLMQGHSCCDHTYTVKG